MIPAELLQALLLQRSALASSSSKSLFLLPQSREVPQLVPELVRAQRAGGLPHVHPSLDGGPAVGEDHSEHVLTSLELRVCPNLGVDRSEPVRVDQDQGGMIQHCGKDHREEVLMQNLSSQSSKSLS